MLESVNKTLNPLMEFTDALSGEKYVSVLYVEPVLHLQNNTVLPLVDDDTDLTKDKKRVNLKYLKEKYDNLATDDLLDMSSLVDPCFKSSYIYLMTKESSSCQKRQQKFRHC